MKEPIKIRDIREGDLIRWEATRDWETSDTKAVEYLASEDGDDYLCIGQHYLIEPRKTAVVLPEEPTLGWVTGTPLGGGLGIDMLIQTTGQGRGGTALRSELYFDSSKVTAFTPATPIPTALVDDLREAYDTTWGSIRPSIAALLEAVEVQS